jgi:hypothetical protein
MAAEEIDFHPSRDALEAFTIDISLQRELGIKGTEKLIATRKKEAEEITRKKYYFFTASWHRVEKGFHNQLTYFYHIKDAKLREENQNES